MNKVTLYVYDLSQGMASMISQSLVGKQLDGIWVSHEKSDNSFRSLVICDDLQLANNSPFAKMRSIQE